MLLLAHTTQEAQVDERNPHPMVFWNLCCSLSLYFVHFMALLENLHSNDGKSPLGLAQILSLLRPGQMCPGTSLGQPQVSWQPSSDTWKKHLFFFFFFARQLLHCWNVLWLMVGGHRSSHPGVLGRSCDSVPDHLDSTRRERRCDSCH